MFTFSKLFWVLVQPSNLMLVLLVLATGGLLLGYRRAGLWLLGGVTAVLATVTLLPVGIWLLTPIENRFPVPSLPEHVDGVVMLGGAVKGGISASRGQIALSAAAERVTALQALARRYPDARLVVTTGFGRLVSGQGHPARALEAYFPTQGLDPARIVFEDRSRNTHDNAILTKQLVKPLEGERWLLVTSAFHMPRAIGVFRQVGWPVTAYPVDFRTQEATDLAPLLGGLAEPNVAERLLAFDTAIKAWVGLIAYRLLGRTDALLPAP